MTLHALQQSGVEVRALVATVTEEYRRVSMHGVPVTLLAEQARNIGIRLEIAWLPRRASNEIYRERFAGALAPFREEGCTRVAYGDIHLADVRRWREAFMGELGFAALFPLWGQSPPRLVERFVDLGARAWITCVDPARLPPEFAGRPLDRETLDAFPAGADPCGENGEYHSFVWDGPWLSAPVACRPGRRVQRDGFRFCDLEPG